MDKLTKEEWSDWRELTATKTILNRMKEFRMLYLLGVLAVSRGGRDEVVDSVIGMDLIIDIVDNIHKEEVS
jgi:hypothetical protein